MSGSTWDSIGWGPWSKDGSVPQETLDEETRARLDLPRTLVPVVGEGLLQRPVFDPSLLHYRKAMRAGEPSFADAAAGSVWRAAHRQALDHVLAAVAASPWSAHLVLRGSVLLRAWFGKQAREPGDLDFVVVPRSWNTDDPRTGRMLDEIARAAEEMSLRREGVRLSADSAVQDKIWTYDRVPGRRLVIPWTRRNGENGSVQLDFVFNEKLPEAPVPADIPLERSGGFVRMNAASHELSLAWKILWLIDDWHPQGKDLYDAVLLAEGTPLSLVLLSSVSGREWGSDVRSDLLEHIAERLDEDSWAEFRKDNPLLSGTLDEYLARLAATLVAV
jgi:hypothetical protein